MTILDSIILGIVQGLTEFLPISSSGHLVIFQKVLGYERHDLNFDVVAHLGTLLSVLWIYKGSIFSILRDLIEALKTRQANTGSNIFSMIVLGSVPTAIIGLSFKDTFEQLFSSLLFVGIFLIFTGFLLFLTKGRQLVVKSETFANLDGVEKIKWHQALLVGLAQGLAIAPGISRSGSTIAAGILVGLDRKTASLYSFMLSTPAILGAVILKLKDIEDWDWGQMSYLVSGFFSSFFTGLLGLTLILHFVKKGKLEVFSAYLWLVGFSIIAIELLN